jgi:glycerol-3-phosphate dehydrogenase (NAD(P)+)
MKVGFLGSGAWGITLADLISRNGHELVLWSIEDDVLNHLEKHALHPKFLDFPVCNKITYTRDLNDIKACDVIVECVTAKGFRSVCEALGEINVPFVITSKGIEQESGKLLVEVAYEIFEDKNLIGVMSGPTLAKEVMFKHPTGAIGASLNSEVADIVKDVFESPCFQVETSLDVFGVAVGGSVKNVIAIASGLAEGLEYGYNTKALIITEGLREMAEITKVKGGLLETCYGLAGIGDLIVTGVSNLSRNFTFGMLLGQGGTAILAKEKIGMVVEGEYTVLSAYNITKEHNLDLPIVAAMYRVVYENENPETAFTQMLSDIQNLNRKEVLVS